MKYETGQYLIRLFDRYGTKVGPELHAPNLIKAKVVGENAKKDGSYVVLRVLANSQDRK